MLEPLIVCIARHWLADAAIITSKDRQILVILIEREMSVNYEFPLVFDEYLVAARGMWIARDSKSVLGVLKHFLNQVEEEVATISLAPAEFVLRMLLKPHFFGVLQIEDFYAGSTKPPVEHNRHDSKTEGKNRDDPGDGLTREHISSLAKNVEVSTSRTYEFGRIRSPGFKV